MKKVVIAGILVASTLAVSAPAFADGPLPGGRPPCSIMHKTGTGIDGPLCVDSTGLLDVGDIPRRIVILGGGVIGVEFASILSHFGSEVTIVEMLPQIVPTEEPEIGRELARAFGRKGITCLTSAQVGTRLFISPRTVETHRARILEKLGARSVIDLVRLAARQSARTQPS